MSPDIKLELMKLAVQWAPGNWEKQYKKMINLFPANEWTFPEGDALVDAAFKTMDKQKAIENLLNKMAKVVADARVNNWP